MASRTLGHRLRGSPAEEAGQVTTGSAWFPGMDRRPEAMPWCGLLPLHHPRPGHTVQQRPPLVTAIVAYFHLDLTNRSYADDYYGKYAN